MTLCGVILQTAFEATNLNEIAREREQREKAQGLGLAASRVKKPWRREGAAGEAGGRWESCTRPEEPASRRRRAGTPASSGAQSHLAAFAVREMLIPSLDCRTNNAHRGRCRFNEITYQKHRAL